MAEGLINSFFKEKYIGYSAGTEATQVKPLAIAAMKALGIDISRQYSKTIDNFKDKEFDMVITVCDSANENCPFFPRAKTRLHLPFDDPSDSKGTPEEKLKAFMQTRDQILRKLRKILL
jgi:arsenate reductase